MTFTADGVTHRVYFQDGTALAAKLAELHARHSRIAGISTWVMGEEAPGFWPLITGGLR